MLINGWIIGVLAWVLAGQPILFQYDNIESQNTREFPKYLRWVLLKKELNFNLNLQNRKVLLKKPDPRF